MSALRPSPFKAATMAANECTHVSIKETDAKNEQEHSDINVEELSSIQRPMTPVHLIVQRQIREVVQLQDMAVSHLQESVLGQESFMRDNLIPKQHHLSELKHLQKTFQDCHVSREDYDEVVQNLEEEQRTHAETRLRLIETTDKLDFTLVQIDALNKQLIKEKKAFQQIVDSLRSQVAKGDNWNEELEAKYSMCQKQCQDLSARLVSREATIETLEGRLSSQQKQCERKIEEIKVEREQDQYITRMLDEPKTGRTKPSVNISNKTTAKMKR